MEKNKLNVLFALFALFCCILASGCKRNRHFFCQLCASYQLIRDWNLRSFVVRFPP